MTYTRPQADWSEAERSAWLAEFGGPLFCDCVVPIRNVIRFYGLDMGDCALCQRPIRKDIP